MAKHVMRQELSLENRQAKKAAKDATKEVDKFGKTGEKAGKKVTTEAQKTKDAFGQLGSQLGLNIGAFVSWQLGAVAAVGLVVTAIKKVIDNLKEVDRRLSETYARYAELAEQPGTRALAKLRGQTPEQVALDLERQAARFKLPVPTVRETAYGIESALPGVAGTRDIVEDALRLGRVTGAGPQALSGLVSAAQEAGIAKTRGQYRQFLAKAAALADKSKFNLGQFGEVLTKTLPLAVSAGLDPDWFASLAVAMSFRYTEPTRLATDLERLIRGAGRKGKQEIPAGVLAGGAAEIIKWQAGQIGKAFRVGPQEGMAAAEALGLPSEMATVYGGKLGPDIFAKQQQIIPVAQAARAADIDAMLEEWKKTGISKYVAAKGAQRIAKIERATRGAAFETRREQMKAAFEILADEPGAAGLFARALEVVPGLPFQDETGADIIQRAGQAAEAFVEARGFWSPVEAAGQALHTLFGVRPSSARSDINISTVNIPPPQDRAAGLRSKQQEAAAGAP